MSRPLTIIFAVACGAMVANIYYAQSLIGIISPSLGLHASLAGFVVTISQLGYAAGLIAIVSLADLIENRRLILCCVAATIAGLTGVALASSAPMFFISSFVVGMSSVGAQVLVPFASLLAPPEQRGRAIGNVMGGLVAGIMLSRPLASFVAASFGWRAIFAISAVVMLAIFALLWRNLPVRQPRTGMHYGQILVSIGHLLARYPMLRRRAIYQAVTFCVFNLFWTAVPLVLTHRFGIGQRGIALFALAGAGGALAAPIAGRLTDRGLIRSTTLVAMVVVVAAFALSGWAVAAGTVVVLALAAVALDAATQINQIVGQRVVYGISEEARGRINAAYMTSIFLAGSAGSALSAITYVDGGWQATATTGAVLGVAVLAYAVSEPRPAPV